MFEIFLESVLIINLLVNCRYFLMCILNWISRQGNDSEPENKSQVFRVNFRDDKQFRRFLCVLWETLQEFAKKYVGFHYKIQIQENSPKFAHLQKQVTVSSMSIDLTKFLLIFEVISLEMAEYLMAFVAPAWDELPDDLVIEVRKFEIMFDENIFFFVSEKSHLKFKGRELKKPLEIDSEIWCDFFEFSFSTDFFLVL